MTTDSESTSSASGAPPPRWIIKAFTRGHMLLHRLTGGRCFNTLGGDEVCFVTITGAKSGRSLIVPLMYIPYRQGVLLVASQGGSAEEPDLVLQPGKKPRHRGHISRQPDESARPPRNRRREARTLAHL